MVLQAYTPSPQSSGEQPVIWQVAPLDSASQRMTASAAPATSTAQLPSQVMSQLAVPGHRTSAWSPAVTPHDVVPGQTIRQSSPQLSSHAALPSQWNSMPPPETLQVDPPWQVHRVSRSVPSEQLHAPAGSHCSMFALLSPQWASSTAPKKIPIAFIPSRMKAT